MSLEFARQLTQPQVGSGGTSMPPGMGGGVPPDDNDEPHLDMEEDSQGTEALPWDL